MVFEPFLQIFEFFWSLFANFCQFLRIFSLPILPNRYNPTLQTLFLPQKPTFGPKNLAKNPVFPKFQIISVLNFSLCLLYMLI